MEGMQTPTQMHHASRGMITATYDCVPETTKTFGSIYIPRVGYGHNIGRIKAYINNFTINPLDHLSPCGQIWTRQESCGKR